MLVDVRSGRFRPHNVSWLHSITRKCHSRIDLDAVVRGTLVLRTRYHALDILVVLVPINGITKRRLD